MSPPHAVMCASSQPQRSLIARFLARSADQAGAPAIIDGERQVTYGDLSWLAAHVAAGLRDHAVGPGDVVAVWLDRSIEAVAAMLGVLWSGAAYLPLAPKDPPERRRALCTAAGARVVVTLEGVAPIPGASGLVACSVPQWRHGRCAAGPAPSVDLPTIGRESSAAILFTSGSHGTPKPVDIPHRAIHRLVFGQHYASFGPGRTFLHLAPLSFDASTFELWGALLHGGRLVIEPGDVPDLENLEATISTQRVTTAWLNAALFNVVIDERPQALAPLDELLIGGEALSVAHVRKALRCLPHTRLVNGYGPTENTTFSTCYTIPRDLPEDLASIPIGRALAHSTARIVDEHLRSVGVGVEGEILVGGEGIARGYRNRPDLTADAFVPDPDGIRGDELAYRTGDRGVMLPDGNLVFLGRRDAQVKIRGFRIEPGEIEAVANATPGVKRASVVAVSDVALPVAEKRLVAFVVSDEGEPITARVRAHAGRVLPPYMVPSDVRAIDELPLTPHGKVDRHALEELAAAGAGRAGTVAETRTTMVTPGTRQRVEGGVSAEVLAIVADLLGREPCPTENLPAAGFHSLVVARLAARLSERLGVRVTARDVFAHPTVADLLAWLPWAARGARPTPSGPVPVPRPNRRAPFALTHAQQRAWLVQMLAPTSTAYTFEAALRLRGGLDTAALERALDALVVRHEVLRTSFPLASGSPVQRIHDAGVVSLAHVDLADRPAPEVEAAIEADRQVRSSRPFRLEQLPLVEWTLYRTQESTHVLHHREHHVLHDGASFFVLLNELAALYRADVLGHVFSLPPLPMQIGDVAELEQVRLDRGDMEASRAYWRGRLAGAPALSTWRTERPRPPIPSYVGDCVRLDLDADLVRGVRAAAARAGVTFFTAMLAPFARQLAVEGSASEVCIGTGVANRNDHGSEAVVGMLVNNAVLRLKAGSAVSLRALMRDTQDSVAEALEHQAVPFDIIVRDVGAHQVNGVHPLCQVFFSALEGQVPLELGPGVEMEVDVGLPTRSAKFDHNVVLVVQRVGQTDAAWSERVSLIWEFASDLYSRQSMEARLQRYLAWLAGLPASLDTPLELIGTEGSTVDAPTMAEKSQRPRGAELVRPATLGSPHADRVTSIVGDVLGRDDVRPDDDFFSLGGHSLLAVRLASRLADATGRSFPVRHLFADATVRGICRVLDAEGSVELPRSLSRGCVTVQEGRQGRPLFLVAGAGGDDGAMAFYARLAPSAPGRAVVGLRAVDPGPPPVLLRPGVASLAEMFADHMLRVDGAEEPFDLVGGCTGGVVAFAVACELQRRGRAVGRLVLLDSRCPSRGAAWKASARMACSAVRRRAQQLLGLGHGEQAASPRAETCYRVISRGLPFDENDAPADVSPASRAFVVATMRHRPEVFNGDLHVIASEEFAALGRPGDWRPYVRGHVRVVVVPGTHETYIRDHLDATSEALRDVLGARA